MASTPQPGPTPEAAARTTNDSPGHDAQTIGTAGPGSNQAPDDPQLQPARSQDPESQGLPANANAVWIVTERWFDRYSPGHAPGAFQIVGVFTTLKDANSAAQKSATRVTNEVRGSLDFPESGTTVTGNYGRICIPLGNPESNGPLCLISVERHTLVQEFQQGAWREVLAAPLIELTEDGGRLLSGQSP